MDKTKKNILVISDENGSCIDSIIATNLFNIKLVVVPYKSNVEALKEKYKSTIEKFIYFIPDTNREFQDEFYADYNLTYDEIEKFRHTQLKCYRYNTRFINDDNDNSCIYYTALKFFLWYFNNYSIDCVFSRIMEHGSISDSIVFDVARSLNIPVYIFSSYTGSGYKNMLSLLDYNKKELVDLSSINKGTIEFKSLLSSLNKNYSSNPLLKLPFSKLITKFISTKNKTFIKCIKWFYKNKILMYKKNIKCSLKEDLFKIREETSLHQMIKGHFYHSKLRRYYKKHSIRHIEDEKFLFYPLHMEPEASILARTLLNCQQFIIEQIAKMLPEGYYLYVKEHPDQFLAIQYEKYYHKSIFNYRNIDFYKRLTKIKNVKLISTYVPSAELIDKAKCVISITGSALMESVAKNKPVIIFGSSCSFIEYLKDTFVINGIESVKNAINKVIGGFEPNYIDFDEIITRYVFSFDNDNFYKTDTVLVEVFSLMHDLINK